MNNNEAVPLAAMRRLSRESEYASKWGATRAETTRTPAGSSARAGVGLTGWRLR
jgi:hypothetical protein